LGLSANASGQVNPKFKAFTVRTPDGVNISAQEWGKPDGQPIVFIHGFMQSHLSWSKQVNSSLANEFRIITYDFRGHGNSDKIMDPALYNNGEKFADELNAVMDTAGIKKAVIVGWSYGTRITSDYLMKYGTGRLIGVNYVGSAQSGDAKLFGPGAVYIGKAQSEDLATNIQAVRDFVRACFEKQPTPEELEMMLCFNAMVPTKIRSWLRRPAPYENMLKAINVPFLISHGVKDNICVLDMAKYVASLVPNPKTSYYEGVGHSPFWEESERFNSELASFIREAVSKSR
jgi:non-heme chloroperoxidase